MATQGVTAIQKRRTLGQWLKGYTGQKYMTTALFLAIPVALLILFTIIPAVNMIIFSFQQRDQLGVNVQWVGFDNYKTLFTDMAYLSTLINSLYYFVGSFIQLGLALFIATLLCSKIKLAGLFKGVIFFGLMLTQKGPKVLEYNARFGDPEAQVVLPRMKTDLVEMFEACIDGKLAEKHLEFEDNAAVCVVLASDGYPVSYEKGYPITGFEKFHADEGYYCFHAGTKRNEKGIVTNGGRVLGVTAKGTTLKEARANAYKATEWIEFDNKYMRHDIGKAIDEA